MTLDISTRALVAELARQLIVCGLVEGIAAAAADRVVTRLAEQAGGPGAERAADDYLSRSASQERRLTGEISDDDIDGEPLGGRHGA